MKAASYTVATHDVLILTESLHTDGMFVLGASVHPRHQQLPVKTGSEQCSDKT